MMTRHTILRSGLILMALVVTVAGVSGCESVNNPFARDPDKIEADDSDYVHSQPFAAPEYEAVWDRARHRLNLAGYAIDETRTNHSERLLVSHWRTLLATARYKGRRTRCWVRFHESGTDRWVVAIAVQTQRNTDLQDPTNPIRASWEAQPADVNRANLLAYQLEQDFAE